MKACVHTRYGGPEVVRIKDVAVPVPRRDEVLIQVRIATVNRTDAGFRSAEYVISRVFSGLLYPKQKVLGCEFSGVIAAVGADVKAFKAGDRVFGFDDTHFGAHAEYLCLPQNAAIAKIPAGLGFLDAAALTEGAHYALVDIRAAGVKQGQSVLVYGATGAIGSAAVQLLRHIGCHITAVCAGEHAELVQRLGAHQVIDYTREDFRQCGQKFQFVFDAVGKTSFSATKPLLLPKGIYISTELGKNGSNVFLALYGKWHHGKKVLFPIPSITAEDVAYLGRLAADGHFKPVLDRIYPMDQIVEAYRYVETGMKVGNVLLAVGE